MQLVQVEIRSTDDFFSSIAVFVDKKTLEGDDDDDDDDGEQLAHNRVTMSLVNIATTSIYPEEYISFNRLCVCSWY